MDYSLPPIIQRLKIDEAVWITTMSPGGNHFHRAIGSLSALRTYAKNIKQRWLNDANSNSLYD